MNVRSIITYFHKNSKLLNIIDYNYKTRAKMLKELKNNTVNITIAKNVLISSGVKFYNAIPEEFREQTNIKRFNKKGPNFIKSKNLFLSVSHFVPKYKHILLRCQ